MVGVLPGACRCERIVVAGQIERRFEAHRPDRERPGLVDTEHIDAAEILDRAQAFDDHPGPSHLARTARQRQRHHSRQQLRGDTDRQREGEQERVQNGAIEGDVDDEHSHDEQHTDAHQQEAERAQTPLERRRRLGHPELRPDPTQLGLTPVRTTTTVALPLVMCVPRNTLFRRLPIPADTSATPARL